MDSPAADSFLSVKRCHGLGNVIMLLPVLDGLAGRGVRVRLVTRTQWVPALQRLRPEFVVSDRAEAGTLDLDAATESLRPEAHRGDEFAEMLGFVGPVGPARMFIPPEWGRPFERWKGGVGFAPEAGHPSREWPARYSSELAERLGGAPLVLLGTRASPPLSCDLDTRGRLSLEELLGLLSVLRLVICMDSGMLHLSAGAGVPTIAIFGGVEPAYRIREEQHVVALQAALDCCPCNKLERCEGRYDCIKAITPAAVLDAVEGYTLKRARTVRRV